MHVYCPMTPPAGVHALLAGAHRSLPYELSHVSALTRYLGHCPLECCRAALSMCMSPLGFEKAADIVQRWYSCGSLKRCESCADSTLRTRSCGCRLHGRWSWSHSFSAPLQVLKVPCSPDVATTGWVSRRILEVRHQRSRRLTVAQSARQRAEGIIRGLVCASRAAGARVHEP